MGRSRANRILWLILGALVPLPSAWLAREVTHRLSEPTVIPLPEDNRSSSPTDAASDAAATRGEPARFGLSGWVLDEHGQPIADAEVWLEDMGKGAVARSPAESSALWLGTDSDGRFTAPRLPASLYTLTAAAREFRPRTIALELDAETEGVVLELAPAPSPEVLVLDPEGRPVSDALVVACSEGSEITLRSAWDGTAAFGTGAIGCAAVAHHTRFARSAPVRLRPGRQAVKLERGGSIEGVVTNRNGRALFDAEIELINYFPSETEAPLSNELADIRLPVGRDFRLAGLAPGTYTLRVARRIHGETGEELARTDVEVPARRPMRGVHIVVEALPEEAIPDEV